MKITKSQLRHGIRQMIREQAEMERPFDYDNGFNDYDGETELQRSMFDLGKSHGWDNISPEFPNDIDYADGYDQGQEELGRGEEPKWANAGSAVDEDPYGEDPWAQLDT